MENWHGVSSVWLLCLAFRVGIWVQREMTECSLLREDINDCSIQYPSEQETSWKASELNHTWKQYGLGAGFAVYAIQIMQLKTSTQWFGVWYWYRCCTHELNVCALGWNRILKLEVSWAPHKVTSMKRPYVDECIIGSARELIFF